jgi:hypothetical protein
MVSGGALPLVRLKLKLHRLKLDGIFKNLCVPGSAVLVTAITVVAEPEEFPNPIQQISLRAFHAQSLGLLA